MHLELRVGEKKRLVAGGPREAMKREMCVVGGLHLQVGFASFLRKGEKGGIKW